MKMKGDYFRYIAEFSSGSNRETAAQDSQTAYNAAYEESKERLPSTHPVRLGLALNFSVFYFEILKA